MAAPVQSVTFRIDDAPPPWLTFLSGYQSTTLTNEGGRVNGYAGSNLDGWYCYNLNPAWCTTSIGADGSIKMDYLLQPKALAKPNTDGYIGSYIVTKCLLLD